MLKIASAGPECVRRGLEGHLMLLRFRVTNHRSIRDTAELSLVSSGFSGARPADQDWIAATTRVAGIYGANASGKSTLLEALGFMTKAVTYSATTWGSMDRFPHHPFTLDAGSRGQTSQYELDFVLNGVRLAYGFESSVTGIHREWLYSYPTGRKRVLFERSGPSGDDLEFGRSLPGENIRIARLLRPTSLYLSTAANSNHRVLGDVHRWIAHRIRHAEYTEADRRARITWARNIMENENVLSQAVGLLKFADLGITGMVLEEEDLDEDVIQVIRGFFDNVTASEGPPRSDPDLDKILSTLKKKIKFTHSGADPKKPFLLSLEEESSGTVAWLALGVPALLALRDGNIMTVDELDASLHPRLAAALVGMFKDPELNPKGAQLIFTSHETSLLGNMPGIDLSKDEIWFTEKAADGATELFSMAEFPVRPTDNFERRYLQGRYGAVPMISPEQLRGVVLRDAR
ncbi:ATP-binding protein [Streptosporangium sp. NPDC002524]|uniref:AAA family ATPase n=1 Tax=Streptosporangium sp. NPDC002524 TaxID=3154537 RepID=UPI00331C6D05